MEGWRETEVVPGQDLAGGAGRGGTSTTQPPLYLFVPPVPPRRRAGPGGAEVGGAGGGRASELTGCVVSAAVPSAGECWPCRVLASWASVSAN